MKKLKILYHIPSLESVYATRFIYEGYKDAFLELGYEFRPLTSRDNIKDVLAEYNPNIFISSLNRYTLKFLDLELLNTYRKKGLVYFNQIGLWNLSFDQFGSQSLQSQKGFVALIKKGLAGDIFFNWYQQDDPAMDGFSKTTKFPFHTILLASNPKKYYFEYDDKYASDISFVGSYLPEKRKFINERIIPLKKKYTLSVYGSDWTIGNRALGYIQKLGQYFNIDPLKKIRRIGLSLDDERKVYSSSIISLNVHEDHQRKYGSDFNERTFKILSCGGFEICDNVHVLRRYFSEKELIIGENKNDWFEKIDYFYRNPEKRLPIIKAGKNKVLKHHTYVNRVKQIIKIYEKTK
jgi:hypothetical protein